MLAPASAVLGCGPVLYTVNSIPATNILHQADEAGAAEASPYEFYMADAYLDKAREEAGQAHYEDANHFAEIAAQNATKALDIARRRMREAGR